MDKRENALQLSRMLQSLKKEVSSAYPILPVSIS